MTTGARPLAEPEREAGLRSGPPGHRSSHRSLLCPAVRASRRNADAIVVPASRPAGNLRTAVDLAAALDCWLLVLCSRQARAADTLRLARGHPHLRMVAVDVPAGYRHRLVSFGTSSFAGASAPQLGDLSLKRNLGLLFARLLGWRSVLLLDDDIRRVGALQVRRAARALGRFAAAGLLVREYPDNSVVCHAHRLSGGRQDVFVTGSALMLDCDYDHSFFPDVYNEDWLFLTEPLQSRSVAYAGEVGQLRHQPFASPQRASGEEFGDVLGEGLVGLVHAGRSVADADADYWDECLTRRKAFIGAVADRLDPQAHPDVLAALAAAERRRSQLSGLTYESFVAAWQADGAVWRSRMRNLPALPTPAAAADCLHLERPLVLPPAVRQPGHLRPRPAEQAVVIHPSARVADTARIGIPPRRLQEGEWDRTGRPTEVGEGCDVGHYCLIGQEVRIGAGTVVDTYSLVEFGATVGRNVVVVYRASIGARARVGAGSVIAGLVCDGSVLGERCRVFGDLIHRQLDPRSPWDAPSSAEASPRLADGVFIGWGATVIGGVDVGAGSYVCAGATVTRDVPPGHIVVGVNELVDPDDWAGSLGRTAFRG